MASARYDKYTSGFRARLAADWTTTATPTGVGLDSDGRVVAGDGNTGVRGVFVADSPKAKGEVVDVMTDGEVVDCEGLTAGTSYLAGADGTLSTTTGGTAVGFTAEATRLLVRVS